MFFRLGCTAKHWFFPGNAKESQQKGRLIIPGTVRSNLAGEYIPGPHGSTQHGVGHNIPGMNML